LALGSFGSLARALAGFRLSLGHAQDLFGGQADGDEFTEGR